MADASEISLRLADSGDAEGIYDMLVGLSHAVGDRDKMVSTVYDIRSHGFADPPAFHALLAELDGRTVGLSLFFYSFSTWLGRPGVYIQDLYVDTPARGTGLGQRLVAETARIARAYGADHLRLSVYHDNPEAQRFYRRIGMRHRDDELIFQADGGSFEALAGSGEPV